MIYHAITWAILIGISISLYIFLPRRLHDEVDSFGEFLAEKFKEVFADPLVKRGMSLMRREGVEQHVEKEVERDVISKIIETQFPEAKLIAEYFGLEDYLEEPERLLPVIMKYRGLFEQFLPKQGQGQTFIKGGQIPFMGER